MTKINCNILNIWLYLVVLLWVLAGCATQQTPVPEMPPMPDLAEPRVSDDTAKTDMRIDATPKTSASDASIPAVLDDHKKRSATGARTDLQKAAKSPDAGQAEAKPDFRPSKKQHAGGPIVINFDDADLYEVIKTLGELLGISYIVDPNVRGTVTIHTSGGLSRADLFPIFFQILEVNGLIAINEEGLYRIVPLKEAARLPLPAGSGRQSANLPPGERMTIQIIPLKNISAQEMTKLLTPFVSAGGMVVSHADSNSLVVVDKSVNIDKLLHLVDAFDVDLFNQLHYRFYRMENVDVQDVTDILNEVFSIYKSARKAEIKFIAIERIDTVLVISTDREIFDRVHDLIVQLDATSEATGARIYVYPVKNGEAADLAEILNQVFASKTTTKTKDSKTKTDKDKGKIRGNPFGQNNQPKETEKKDTTTTTTTTSSAPGGGGEGTGSATLRGEIAVTADEVRNVLLIEAIPSDYQIVLNILNQIDILPRQVLIEATVAEIQLNADLDLGVDWSYVDGTSVGSGILEAAISGTATSNLKVKFGIADKISGILSAMAHNDNVNILSSPHVLASDNKEARIDVSTEVPVASSETTTTGTNPVTTTSIQYRDTGVILVVTPHINDRGLVTLDIEQEVSELNEDEISVGGNTYPSFFKRSVVTTLTVADSQTIVIGGLIREKKDDSKDGIPWLVDVPILGWLFGKESNTSQRAELIVLLTPRVIDDLEDIDRITSDFRDKVNQAAEIIRLKIDELEKNKV